MGKLPMLKLPRRSRRRLRLLVSSSTATFHQDTKSNLAENYQNVSSNDSSDYYDPEVMNRVTSKIDDDTSSSSISDDAFPMEHNFKHQRANTVSKKMKISSRNFLPLSSKSAEGGHSNMRSSNLPMQDKIQNLVKGKWNNRRKNPDHRYQISNTSDTSHVVAQSDYAMGMLREDDTEEFVDFNPQDKISFDDYFSKNSSLVPQDRRHRIIDPYRDFKIQDDDDHSHNEQFEDEFDPNQNGRDSTASSFMKNQYYQQKRLIIFTVVMVVVSILSISLGVSLGKKKMNTETKNSEESNTIEDNSMNNSNDVVQAPPYNINELCTIENIATTEGHDKCAHVCSFASCCMAPGNQSCFLEQEALCGLYSSCGILHSQTEGGDFDDSPKQSSNVDENFVAPPPDNLLFLCSPESLSSVTGFLSCQASCHSGQCCTTNNSPEMIAQTSYAIRPCRDSHPNICNKYKPCDALYNNNSENKENNKIEPSPIVPQTEDIIKKLHEICSPEILKSPKSNLKKECEHVCQSRSCCYTSNFARNCKEDNEVWCEKFSPCKNLVPKQQTSPNENSKNDDY